MSTGDKVSCDICSQRSGRVGAPLFISSIMHSDFARGNSRDQPGAPLPRALDSTHACPGPSLGFWTCNYDAPADHHPSEVLSCCPLGQLHPLRPVSALRARVLPRWRRTITLDGVYFTTKIAVTAAEQPPPLLRFLVAWHSWTLPPPEPFFKPDVWNHTF